MPENNAGRGLQPRPKRLKTLATNLRRDSLRLNRSLSERSAGNACSRLRSKRLIPAYMIT